MPRRKHVIGLTGNIACGKSTVVQMLVELGAEAIDGDRLVHDMMGPNSPLGAEIRAAFGDETINADGSINRPALGAIVFSDPAKLRRLEEITHPPVVAHKRAAIMLPGPDVLILDAIKLFEAGIAEECDENWVVTSTREQQIARIMGRNKVERAEAERRIDAQPPQAEKVAKADLVIDNSGTLEQTRAQVAAAWQRLAANDTPAPKA